jgi:hypothetical protein
MRQAWLLIAMSGAACLAGRVCPEILGVASYLNPLVYADIEWLDAGVKLFRQTGVLIGGPLQMALLVWGLAAVLRVERRSGLFPRLTTGDYASRLLPG